MRECSEYEITIEKLLNVVHSYTDPIRIQVVIGDAWLTCEEARGTRRLHDFYLTKAHTKYDDKEKERLLKYYKDVPVWNITAWHDVDCRQIRYGIEARCHYKDVREGYLAEKADRKRAKERERRKKKRGRVMTNADCIRHMTDEQLYEFLSEWECGDIDYSVTFCDLCNEATKRGEIGNVLNLDCDGCRKHWLQRDAVDYGGLMYWKKNITFDTDTPQTEREGE